MDSRTLSFLWQQNTCLVLPCMAAAKMSAAVRRKAFHNEGTRTPRSVAVKIHRTNTNDASSGLTAISMSAFCTAQTEVSTKSANLTANKRQKRRDQMSPPVKHSSSNAFHCTAGTAAKTVDNNESSRAAAFPFPPVCASESLSRSLLSCFAFASCCAVLECGSDCSTSCWIFHAVHTSCNPSARQLNTHW
jgi:hypothetical protein